MANLNDLWKKGSGAPSSEALVEGGLGIDTTNGAAYSKKADGTIFQIGTPETVTSLTLAANVLTYTDENGSESNLDLSVYLDDTNLARIISGTYDSDTQELVFTRDDSSTFRVDASMFFDDTNLVTSVNGDTGAVSITPASIGAQPAGDYEPADSTILKDADVLTAVSDTNKLVTQSDISDLGGGDMLTSVYDTTGNGIVDNAEKVNGLTVQTSVPAGAVFTDTTYTSSDFNHDDLEGFVAAEHIDWTVAQPTVINAANYTNTVYTHPTYAGDDINLDTGVLTGAIVISDLDFNVTTDTSGHVTDANATYATRTLTAGDIGAATTTSLNNEISRATSAESTLANAITDLETAVAGIQAAGDYATSAELNATNTGAGLGTDGSYIAPTATIELFNQDYTNLDFGENGTQAQVMTSTQANLEVDGTYTFVFDHYELGGTYTGTVTSLSQWDFIVTFTEAVENYENMFEVNNLTVFGISTNPVLSEATSLMDADVKLYDAISNKALTLRNEIGTYAEFLASFTAAEA